MAEKRVQLEDDLTRVGMELIAKFEEHENTYSRVGFKIKENEPRLDFFISPPDEEINDDRSSIYYKIISEMRKKHSHKFRFRIVELPFCKKEDFKDLVKEYVKLRLY